MDPEWSEACFFGSTAFYRESLGFSSDSMSHTFAKLLFPPVSEVRIKPAISRLELHVKARRK